MYDNITDFALQCLITAPGVTPAQTRCKLVAGLDEVNRLNIEKLKIDQQPSRRVYKLCYSFIENIHRKGALRLNLAYVSSVTSFRFRLNGL